MEETKLKIADSDADKELATALKAMHRYQQLND